MSGAFQRSLNRLPIAKIDGAIAPRGLYLPAPRLDAGGESHNAESIASINRSSSVTEAPFYTRWSMNFYEDYLGKQERFTRRTNPDGHRLLMGQVQPTEQSAAAYRRHNRLPMQLWMAVSLAPHSYLFAIFGMLDELPLYLMLRLTLMNGIALVALLLQRRASRLTLQAYDGTPCFEPAPSHAA